MQFIEKVDFDVFAIETSRCLQPCLVEFLAKLCVQQFNQICHEPKLYGQSGVYWRTRYPVISGRNILFYAAILSSICRKICGK